MESLDAYWHRGRAFEAAHDLASAQAEYAALLAVDGRHIPARLRMSRFAQLEGDYVAAHQHALQAADAARLGGSSRHLAFVTLRLLDFSEDAEVASVILSADPTDPEVLRQAPTLAQHLWLVGRYDDALRFLESVSARMPPHPLLLFTRGQVLRFLGRLDEAADAYERCLQLRPDFADAHWAIATNRRAWPAGSRVERLRTTVRRTPPDSPEMAQLQYALFHELDTADDTDAAWRALTEGARIMRKSVRYDAMRFSAHVDALMTPAWIPHSQRVDDRRQPRPIFVVGLPRTGTTLLDRILGNHGWVRSVGERNDFGAAMSRVSGRFFADLVSEGDAGSLLAVDHRSVGHAYIAAMQRLAPGVAMSLDKNPRNLFNIPLILRALPHAKILCLRRDPMDAGLSNLKELFQGGAYAYSYDLDNLAAHLSDADRWMRHWSEQAADSVKVVDYEALVATPEAIVAEVTDFLELPRRKGLTDIAGNHAPVATASSAQVRGPIHARAVGAWTRYASQLSPLQTALDRARHR